MKKIVSGAFLLAFVVTGAFAADDKSPSISEIMKKVNGKAGLQKKVGAGLMEASPDWDALAKQTKDYKKLCDGLGKNDPPKGEKSSWEKLTKKYADDAKKLDDAIVAKDKDAAIKAHNSLKNSCKACHNAHQEK